MASGILTRNTILHNHAMEIKVPKGTIVDMAIIDGTQTIFFRDMPLMCHKINGQWIAEFEEQLILIQFQPEKPPNYPFFYFDKDIVPKHNIEYHKPPRTYHLKA